MIASLAKALKDLTYIWGTLTASVAAIIYYLQEHQDLIWLNSTELGMLFLVIITSAIIWVGVEHKAKRTETKVDHLESKVDDSMNALQRALLRMDVDRFYKDHRDDETLTDDQMKYVYMLRDKLIHHNVNSFSQRKVDELLTKPIKG